MLPPIAMVKAQRWYYLQRYLCSVRKLKQPMCEPLVEWLSSPLPSGNTPMQQLGCVVVDLEMTGLNSKTDQIVSVGWVEISANQVCSSTARHWIIADAVAEEGVGQSATVHQLRDADVAMGELADRVLKEFLAASAGKIVVLHHAPMDCAFLNRLWKRNFAIPFVAPIIDTLALEKKRFLQQNQPINNGDLTLVSCRERYNLPPYPAHNACVDAISTAELLLAITSYKSAVDTQLRYLLSV